jgi:C-terminal leucine zipper domain of cyclic nucleotide-gated channels
VKTVESKLLALENKFERLETNFGRLEKHFTDHQEAMTGRLTVIEDLLRKIAAGR